MHGGSSQSSLLIEARAGQCLRVSLVSAQRGCRRALCTAFPSSVHSFISYWDGDNRISAPSIQESAREGGGNPLTLFPPAHNDCVCVSECDCVGLYSCQMGPALLPTKTTPHSPALILPLVCVSSSQGRLDGSSQPNIYGSAIVLIIADTVMVFCGWKMIELLQIQ